MCAEQPCPDWVDAPALEPPLSRLLGKTPAVASGWGCQRLGGFGRGVGTWRLRGVAEIASERREWSLVLKGWAPTAENATPTAWDWPHREAALYRSGVLTALPPGIRAPRCLDALEREDGTVWIWLEDLGDSAARVRSIDEHATAARHLGQLNGAYLAGRPLPTAPGLARSWLAQWIEAAAPEIALLLNGIDHPRVRTVYPTDVVDVFGKLWASRAALLTRLDRLPACFVHRDAFSRNLFLPAEAANAVETIAIDWEFAGIGFVGEDLAALVAASAIFMDVAPEDIARLERTALAAYLGGLRAAGWDGDPADVHDAYALSAALRFGVGMTRMVVPFLMSDERMARWVAQERTTETETVRQYAAINRWLVDLAASAHGPSGTAREEARA
jgi:hypothetical protein